MMSILDDKTREASTLKVEVHRLMDAVSAGKAALDRLQKERTSSVIPAGGLTVGASSSALNSGWDHLLEIWSYLSSTFDSLLNVSFILF